MSTWELSLFSAVPTQVPREPGGRTTSVAEQAGNPRGSRARLCRQSEQKRFETFLCFFLCVSATDISGLLQLAKPRLLFHLKEQICFVSPGQLGRAVGGVKRLGMFSLFREFLE